MGTRQRTEQICDSFQLTGWKRVIAKRILNGCGNCELRYACISKILDGQDYSAKKLRNGLSLVTTRAKPISTSGDVTWLARDLANISRGQCHDCNALALCLANAHLAAWSKPLDMKTAKRQMERVQANMEDADWPQRVQDVLTLADCGNTTLVKRAVGCFMACRKRDSLEAHDGCKH